MKIADIYTYKNGKKKVVFFDLGCYKLIKHILGFRYFKIDNKWYYLREVKGIYKISSFDDMRYAFTEYITNNFEHLEIYGSIDFETFINTYYKKCVISKGNSTKSYLSKDFELSDYNFHLLKIEIDPSYKFDIESQKLAFH